MLVEDLAVAATELALVAAESMLKTSSTQTHAKISFFKILSLGRANYYGVSRSI
jgi:hypothetical protein